MRTPRALVRVTPSEPRPPPAWHPPPPLPSIRATATPASSGSRGRWPTCSASRCGSASASTACRASCSSTCTTRSPRAAWRWTRPTAAGIVGAYGGAVYLSTILGAWLADRMLGSERVLFVSAIVIMAGHISLAILPGFTGVGVGLVLVALGSGGLKANATSVVGTLYTPEDPRRDAGFSLFYLGINLGAFLGPILTGLAAVRPWVPLGLRARRGRHGDRPAAVLVRPEGPAGGVAGRAKPAAAVALRAVHRAGDRRASRSSRCWCSWA